LNISDDRARVFRGIAGIFFFKTLRSVLRSRIEISKYSDRKNISVDVKESCFDEDRFVFVVSPFLLNTMNLKQEQWCLSLLLWCTVVEIGAPQYDNRRSNTGETPAIISGICEMSTK
jgi:hypothetical protein